MKKIVSFLTLIAILFTLTACDLPWFTNTPDGPEKPGNDVPVTPEDPGDGGEELPLEPETPACTHDYVEIGRTEAKPLSDGVIISECTLCKEQTTEVHTPMTRSLKILAIGNSHSENAVAYLWDICNQAGIKNLVIGNAVVGGTGLDDHGSYILYGTPAYSYTKYEKGKTEKVDKVKIDVALLDEEWDYITIQQRSPYVADSRFTLLDTIIDRLNVKCPDAEIFWHMTWAYEENANMGQSIKNDFVNQFGSDTTVMYDAIIDSVEAQVLTRDKIAGVIPAATVMQNMRSSYLGNNITTDGVHAKNGMAKYAIALLWYSVFTGGSLEQVEWLPGTAASKESILEHYDVIIETVENALKNPYEVTPSQYTTAPAK